MEKTKLLAIGLIWLILFFIGAVIWRYAVAPARDEAAREARRREEKAKIDATSGGLPYEHEISLALDSFTGYAILRSKRFEQLLRQREIKLNLVDDQANYPARLAGLRDGNYQMAAFTIDALIKASAESGQMPATIVCLIDETRGADAMVAYKDAIRNVDDLNHEQTRFVLTPDSPSETLARVVISNFSLERLADAPFVSAEDPADVVRQYQRSPKNTRQVFVLWQPYVSQLLKNDNLHVVVDSSRFTGYIVDCLVADRDFLVKSPDVVQQVVECYFTALYEYRLPEQMLQLIKTDAGGTAKLDDRAATQLFDGIAWKNTQDNFAHFGMSPHQPVQHIADMIENITSVLHRTGAIAADPTSGQPNRLYFDGVLRNLLHADFHPGSEREQVSPQPELIKLDDQQWQQLVPVGTLAVPNLVFARGADRLDARSQGILDELINQLKTWPSYYVTIRGNAALRGDMEANRRLARQRALAVQEYLTTHGISPDRVRAIGADPSGSTSVSFILGQVPY